MGVKPPPWLQIAPTEAGGLSPSSSEPLASVSGPPPVDEDPQEDNLAKPGVQSPSDYTTTAFKTQEGFFGWGSGPTSKFAGAEVRDVYAQRRDLQKALEKQSLEEFQARWNRAPDEDEIKDLQSEARVKAEKTIAAEMLKRRGQAGNEVWMDIDPKHRIETLAREGEESLFWRAINPLRASLTGVDVAYTDMGGDAPETISYNEGDAWGGFEWLMRQTPGTQLATVAQAAGVKGGRLGFGFLHPENLLKMAGAWGSEEHIRNIMEGRDLMSEASDLDVGLVQDEDPLDKFLSPVTEFIFGADAATTSDYAVALGMSFVDPDIFTLAGPIADVGKAVGKLPQVSRQLAKVPGTEAYKAAKIEQGQLGMAKVVDAIDAAKANNPEDFDGVLKASMAAVDENFGKAAPVIKHHLTYKAMSIVGATPPGQQVFSAVKAIERFREEFTQTYGGLAHADYMAMEELAPGVKAVDPEAIKEAEDLVAGIQARKAAVDAELDAAIKAEEARLAEQPEAPTPTPALTTPAEPVRDFEGRPGVADLRRTFTGAPTSRGTPATDSFAAEAIKVLEDLETAPDATRAPVSLGEGGRFLTPDDVAARAPKPEQAATVVARGLREIAEDTLRSVPAQYQKGSGNLVEDATDFLERALEVFEKNGKTDTKAYKSYKRRLEFLEKYQLWLYEKAPKQYVDLLGGGGKTAEDVARAADEADPLSGVLGSHFSDDNLADWAKEGKVVPPDPSAGREVPDFFATPVVDMQGREGVVRLPDALEAAPAPTKAPTPTPTTAKIEELRAKFDALDAEETAALDALDALKASGTTRAQKATRVAKAGDATPIPESDLGNAARLTEAQLEHYSAVVTLADIEAKLEATKILSKSVSRTNRAARELSSEAFEAQLQASGELLTTLADEMRQALLEYGRAPLGIEGGSVRGAVTEVAPEQVAAARQAARAKYDKAMTAFQNVALQRMELLGQAGSKDLQNQVEAMRTVVAIKEKSLKKAMNAAKRRKGLKRTALASEKIHAREVARAVKQAKGQTPLVARAAWENAVTSMRKSYDNLAAGEKGAGAGMAQQAIRTMAEGDFLYGELTNRTNIQGRLNAFWKDLLKPAEAVFGTNEEVATIATDTLGMARAHNNEAAELLLTVEDLPQAKRDILKRYLTTTEALPVGGKGVTFYNRGAFGIDGEVASTWAEAVPVLTKWAQSAKEAGPESAPKAVQALARMYANTPTNRGKPLGAGAVLRALEESNGDLDAFMSIIRQQTLYPSGLPRKRFVDEEGVKRLQTFDEALAEWVTEGGKVEDFWAAEARAMEVVTAAAIHAQAAKRGSDRIVEAVTKKVMAEGGVDWEMAQKAMVNMANPAHVGGGYEDALAVFEAMGMRADQIKRYSSLMEYKDAGVLAVGDSGIIPRSFMNELEKDLGRLVNTYDAFRSPDTDASYGALMKFLSGYTHLFNASLVTGLIFPKPVHFANIIFGNFGQMWAEEGFRTAARVTLDTLNPRFAPAALDHLPGRAGARSVLRRKEMAAKLGVPTGEVLPDFLTVATNPDLAKFYDPNLLPDSAVVAEGITMGYLRKVARDNGVLSSFIGTTGLREGLEGSLKQSRLGAALEKMVIPKQTYAAMADAVEQRQRVAMFLDLVVNKKVSPEEAAIRVKRALYDWNSPMSSVEKNTIGRVLMFWTFQRKALEQGARILASPFTGDPLGNTSGALARALGQEGTLVGNTKDMAKSVNAVQEMQREQQDEDPFRRVYPWWAGRAGSKEWMYTEKMDPKLAEAVKAATGRPATHEAYTLPAFTPLEYVNIYFDLIEMAVLNGAPIQAVGEFLVNSGGRMTGPAMEAALGAMTGEQEEKWFKTGANEYSIMDRPIIGAANMMGLIEASNDKKKGGAVRLTPGGQAAYTMISPLSYEMVQFFEPLAEAYYFDQDALPTITRMARQYSGIYKSYYYDAPSIVEGDVDAVKKKMGAYTREAERRSPFTWAPPPSE